MPVSRLASLTGTLLIAAWAAAPAAEPPASQVSELLLDAAVEQALAENPELAQMRSRARAAAEMPSQAGALPDPRIGLDVMEDRAVDMREYRYRIAQEFPFPGKRGLNREVAAHDALAMADEVEEMRLTLVRDVKSAWWGLYYLDRALETVARNQALLRQFVTIAQTKYTVGTGLQQDVLLAQLELSKLLDMELMLQGERRDREAELNMLLNRPTDESVRLPLSVSEELPPVPGEERLLARAETARPLLRAARRQVDAAQSRLALARRDYYPDFMLGLRYDDREMIREQIMLEFSMTVPLYAASKQSRMVEQRSQELGGRTDALQATRQRVRREISQALANLRRSRGQALLLKTGILPQARQTVQSMLAGYQVNKVDFLNLVNAQVSLYDYETRYWKNLSETNQALAALEAAVGQPIGNDTLALPDPRARAEDARVEPAHERGERP